MSVAKSIPYMSVPIAVGVVIQSLYLTIDLFFVSHLGENAVAGVASAGTVSLFSGMLGQLLGIGAVTLIAQALVAGNFSQARQIFSHAVWMAVFCSGAVVVFGYMGAAHTFSKLASGEAAQQLSESYLNGYIPGVGMQIIITVTTFGLRAAGEPYGPLIAQCISVPINLVLTPVLIFGVPGVNGMGTFGAGMATTRASVVAVMIILCRAFARYKPFIMQCVAYRWEYSIARQIIMNGFPAGLESMVIYLYVGAMYWAAAKLGSPVQAAFGISLLIVQALFNPCVSVAHGCVPVAAYYLGAGNLAKFRDTYIVALVLVVVVMVCLTIVSNLFGGSIISMFSTDHQVRDDALYVLMCLSFNFVVAGLSHVNTSILQAARQTIWSLMAVSTRLVIFVAPLYLLVAFDEVALKSLCLLSNLAFLAQALISSGAVYFSIRSLVSVGSVPEATSSLGFDTLRVKKER